MELDSETGTGTVPQVHPNVPADAGARGVLAPTRRPRWRRTLQVGVALGVASGVGVGAAALASAATSGNSPSTNTQHSQSHHFAGPGGFGRFAGGGLGIGFGGLGQVLHGEATIKGPNGYETVEFQTGTVKTLKDVSGSTWSVVVTSSDKTSFTYTVDSGTSVNGGESGISTVKAGDSVSIVAVVSKGTATAKTLIDTTRLQANRASWTPTHGGPPSAPWGPPPAASSTS
jgi:hypothetical protein